MEDLLGSQYATQVAVSTLRDRCKSLQHRVNILEAENIDLRINCSGNEENKSLSEIDRLRHQVTQLTEQKQQLTVKIKMVTTENQDLWNKLGKLTRVNKNLGSQLTKINNTLTQHLPDNCNPTQTTLIRSKTFTQDGPHTKVLQKNLEENDRISLELEDISLKLNDSFSKQKKELDRIVSEISDIQSNDDVIGEDYGFIYDDEIEDNFVDEFETVFNELRALKEQVVIQKNVINQNLENVEKVISSREKCVTDQSTSTVDLPFFAKEDKFTEIDVNCVNDASTSDMINTKEDDRICPMCTQVFSADILFENFQQHVEEHFTAALPVCN